MSWQLANPYGILVDEEVDAWHTGHVNALLPVKDTSQILVGSDSGGVWDCYPTDEYANGLSDDWADPDISTLIQGPDPSVVFAGTANGSVYVSDVPGPGGGPLGSWRQAKTLDASGNLVAPGHIWAGVVMTVAAGNRLILACDNGLLWADIVPGQDLVFRSAQGAAGAFSGVALGHVPGGPPIGSRDVVIAAGDGAASGPALPLSGLFVGRWNAAETVLNLTPSSFPPAFPVAQMRRVSIASCEGSRRFAYAVVSQNDPNPKVGQSLMAVLRSTDGGGSWSQCGMGFFSNAGNQADYNQAIAVAPQAGASSYNSLHVAMGLRRGPFISTDGGDSWTEHGDTGSGFGKSPHLHGDIHTLLFDPNDGKGNTLLVGSDGGVARSRDITANPVQWETRPFNSRLPILQFSGANTPQGRGGMSATFDPAGLVGGGLQDLEDVWSLTGPAATPWRELPVGGDGGYMILSAVDSHGGRDPGQAIYSGANENSPLRFAAWDAVKARLTDRDVIPVRNPPSPVAGLSAAANQYASLSNVWHPHWPDRHDTILVVCGVGASVYGFLFPASSGYVGEWIRIADVPLAGGDFITAVGSRNAEGVWVGSQRGRMFAATPDLDPSKSSVIELKIKPGTPAVGDIKNFLEVRTGELVFAGIGAGILSLDGLQWVPVAGGLPSGQQQRGMSYDARNHHIFAAFDSTVYRSVDDGKSWNPVDAGLPRTAHCSDLAFAADPAGDAFVYVATWGRSIYRMQV
jgi:hypothetical protein